MKTKRHDGRYRMRAEIFPFGDTDRFAINVERNRSLADNLNKWEEDARISWPAFGNADVETTRLFAEAMLEACCLAEQMSAVADDQLTTPDGYMVEYRRGEGVTATTLWERVENGADVPMYDGWAVSKATSKSF